MHPSLPCRPPLPTYPLAVFKSDKRSILAVHQTQALICPFCYQLVIGHKHLGHSRLFINLSPEMNMTWSKNRQRRNTRKTVSIWNLKMNEFNMHQPDAFNIFRVGLVSLHHLSLQLTAYTASTYKHELIILGIYRSAYCIATAV